MSNSRACPGQSSPAEGSFREQRTFPLVETLPSFVSEHSSGQAPLHHMIPISCWENSIKMAPWSVWLAFSNDSSTRETKRGLNVASDLYKFRTVKEESFKWEKNYSGNFRTDCFFSCKTQTDAAEFYDSLSGTQQGKKRKEKKVGSANQNKKNQSFAGMQQQQQLLKSICATHYRISQQFIQKHKTSPLEPSCWLWK